MRVAEECIRDLLPVCSRKTDRKRLVLAIAGKDCAMTLASWCWENLGLKVSFVTLAPKVWLQVVRVFSA